MTQGIGYGPGDPVTVSAMRPGLPMLGGPPELNLLDPMALRRELMPTMLPGGETLMPGVNPVDAQPPNFLPGFPAPVNLALTFGTVPFWRHLHKRDSALLTGIASFHPLQSSSLLRSVGILFNRFPYIIEQIMAVPAMFLSVHHCNRTLEGSQPLSVLF